MNDFNSKINLPKLCSGMGYSGYLFKKIPTFGWYAFNSDKSFVGNVFDVVPPEEHAIIYKIVTKNKPGYLDFNVPYSEVTEQRLIHNLRQTQLWTACYAMAKREVDSYRVRSNGKRASLKETLAECGMSEIITNGVGVISQTVFSSFDMLGLPKDSVGKLLIPTFSSPRHIASLELVPWNTLDQKQLVYMNDEKGWYGQLGHKIVKDLKELATVKGNTWDSKCDYWNDQVIELSDNLTVPEYIKIWTEARNTHFTKSPLEHIKESEQFVELRNHVANLSYKQIEEIERVTGQPLASCWKQAREQQTQVGNLTFIKRDNCYYVRKKGQLQQVSNFCIDIDDIVKQNGKFVRRGQIYFRDKIVPFEIDDRAFHSHSRFTRAITEKFIEYGVGIAIITPQLEYLICQIVASFNENAKIVTS